MVAVQPKKAKLATLRIGGARFPMPLISPLSAEAVKWPIDSALLAVLVATTRQGNRQRSLST
jgi:hypothetical protein